MDSKTPFEVYMDEIFTDHPFNIHRHSSPEKNRNPPQPSLVGSLVLSFAASWFIKNHHYPKQSFNQRSTSGGKCPRAVTGTQLSLIKWNSNRKYCTFSYFTRNVN
jgi:hypothetical protein